MTDSHRPPAEPVGSAGVFNVDPDQDGVSQDPEHKVTSDIDALPADLGL
jgi:hypothetical protein